MSPPLSDERGSTDQASNLFRLALEAAPTGMLMTDRTGRITFVNAQAERLFRYRREELIGSAIERVVPTRFRQGHPAFREDYFQHPSPRAMGMGRELYALRSDGVEVPVEIGLTPVKTPQGDFVLSSIVDITERKRSQELFRLALEAAPTGMLMVDSSGRIALVNAQIEALFGYPREELIGTSVEKLIPERFRGRHATFREGFFSDPQTRAMGAGRELYGVRKDGSEVPIEIGLNPLRTHEGMFVLSSIVDITERRRAIEQLRERSDDLAASLIERDALLQEVHHRVKNNLQLISSLINMQARKLQPGSSREVLAECKRRVEAIGLIHEKLYQSNDYAKVPFSDYARSLIANIIYASSADGLTVGHELISDPIALPVDKAISCGLILNELITNTLKHAYPDGGSGKVRVELRRLPDAKIRMVVTDTGVGIQNLEEKRRAGSLGLQLITTLVQQLEGELGIEVDGGTIVSIEFPFEDPGSQAQTIPV